MGSEDEGMDETVRRVPLLTSTESAGLEHPMLRQGTSLADLQRAWPRIVGMDLGAVTRPSAIVRETLVVECDCAESSHLLSFLEPEIVRANHGIARLRFRIDAKPTAIPAHHHDGPGYGEPCGTCGGHQNHAIHALGNTDTYTRSPRNGRLRNLRKRRENYETRSITVRDEPEARGTRPGGASQVQRQAPALLVGERREPAAEQNPNPKADEESK